MGKSNWTFKLISLWLAMILLTWLQTSSAAPIKISHFRIANDKQKTRLVFDFTASFQHQITHLNNPERLIIDLSNVQTTRPIAKTLFKNTPITDVKVTLNNHRDTRITFYLRDNTSAKTFTLRPSGSYGHRLVVDLYPPSTNQSAVSAQSMPVLPPVVITAKVASVNPVPAVNAVVKPVATSKPTAITNTGPIIVNNPPTAPPKVMPVMSASSAPVNLPNSLPPRDIIIVIDPGHGGKDPGASGPGGYKEKNVVLAISRDLQTLLNNEPGFHAVLTRNGDYFIPLRQRLAIARRNKADMFIAIHADAYKNADAMGASVFALSERGATSEAARWLAEKENYSELIGGGDLPDKDNLLRSVLIDLSQTHTIGVSLQIGGAVLRELSRVTHLHYTRVEQAAFVVLKSPDIPSILVETGYISNPRQERQLINPQYQQQIAYSLMQGIKSYFLRNPPRGTLLSAKRQSFTSYTVAHGDTLPAIAQRFKVSLNDLRKTNRIRKDKIFIGQVLKVPLVVNSEYVVSAYPTLSDIH